MLKLLLVASCALVVSASMKAESIPFDLCPPDAVTKEVPPAPLSFALVDGSGIPWGVPAGENVTLLFGFHSPSASASLPIEADLIFRGTNKIDLPFDDACKGISSGCPEKAGNYLVTIPTGVSDSAGGNEMTFRVHIRSPEKKSIACGSVTLIIPKK